MLSRRGFLLAGTGAALTACASGSARHTAPVDSSGTAAPVGTAPRHVTYGSDASQFGELSVPAGRSAGTVVLIHGGFWLAQYDLSLARPLAADLVARGYTCWNLEYRRVGDGGGWPATLDDVAAGIDKLATLDVDTTRVVAVGHSAGGQLAVWAAGRAKLATGAPGTDPTVHLTGVVSQAGVLDLRTAADTGVGGTAVSDFLGGSPTAQPQRYRDADPIEQVPLTAPVLCVHSHADTNVPYAQSSAYVAAATHAGATARLHTVAGDHFTLIDPSSPAWAVVRSALPALLTGTLPAP